jgi:CelD/BcsL family acetyltransferase involved in cellulose biosynthesis
MRRESVIHFRCGIVAQASVIHARVDLREDTPRDDAPRSAAAPRLFAVTPRAELTFDIHEDLASAERDWRALEATADLTPFQTFGWLSAWQRHIGARDGVKPAIVIGKRHTEVVCLFPFAVTPHGFARRLTFLGRDLCDYNAPLLAPDFAAQPGTQDFLELWRCIHRLIQSTPGLAHDLVVFTKMPETIGAQRNPMMALGPQLHPSGAYETSLGTDWEQYYAGKRSSATRRRDRTKVKKLGETGEVRFVDPQADADVLASLETLAGQKSKQFARMGVPDLFAQPGYIEFLRELASAPAAQRIAHISRLDVGPTWAALNLGLIHRDCYYHVLASYTDETEVARFGPGAAHLRELLKYAISRGLSRFDFTVGDEPYKRDWSDTERRLYDYSAAVTARGWPSAFIASAWRGVKRTIKQTAPLWNAVVKLRSMAAAMRKTPDAAKAAAKPDPED